MPKQSANLIEKIHLFLCHYDGQRRRYNYDDNGNVKDILIAKLWTHSFSPEMASGTNDLESLPLIIEFTPVLVFEKWV